MLRKTTSVFGFGLLLVAFGCGPARQSEAVTVPSVAPTGPALSKALEEEVGTALVPGNRVERLNNGAVFDAIDRELRAAESSVHIVVFIWRPGPPSDRILDALADARERGIDCRILVEQLGSNGFKDEVKPKLEALGCEVRLYLPAHKQGKADELAERNHRKLVIVDGERGITGGFGIHTSWLGHGLTKDDWRDVAVLVEGPAVHGMQRAFGYNWREAGGEPLPKSAYPELAQAGDARAGFVASTDGPANAASRMTYLLVRSARERLWIANSYFVPPDELIALLAKKQQEGVDVRILVPGEHHDVPPIFAAQRSTYPPLHDAGVRLFEYQPSMMHSKLFIVDDRIAAIGSTNMDALSLEQVEEGSLVIDSPELVEQLAADFERDLELSHEIEDPESNFLQRFSRRVLWWMGRNL